MNDRLPPGYPAPADSGPPLTHPSLAGDEGTYADPRYDQPAGWQVGTPASGHDPLGYGSLGQPAPAPTSATDGYGTAYDADALSGPLPHHDPNVGAGTAGYGTDTPFDPAGYGTDAFPGTAYDTGAGTGFDTGGDPGIHTGLYATEVTGTYGGGLPGTGPFDTGTQDTGVWQAATSDEASPFPPHHTAPEYSPQTTAPPLGQWSADGTDTGGWTPGWDTADWTTDTQATTGWNVDAFLTGPADGTGTLGAVDPLTSPQPDPLTDPAFAVPPTGGSPTDPGYGAAPDTAPGYGAAAAAATDGLVQQDADTPFTTAPSDTAGAASAPFGPPAPEHPADQPFDQWSGDQWNGDQWHGNAADPGRPFTAGAVTPDATEARVGHDSAHPADGPEPSEAPAAASGTEDPPPAVPTDYGVPARSRRRAAPRARRSAMLTVAVPSAAVMGMAVVAAASVNEAGTESDEGSTQAAPDPSSVTAVKANSKLDTQLDGLSRKADSFANRASRTQERIDLKKRQEAERKRREAEAARREAMRPKFALPVAQHGLSAYYGQAGANWMSLHTGIDFPVSYGTPVMAATDGTVRTQWDPSYGNMVIVTAPDGTETWYCHLGSAKIRSGSVKAGDVIAYSGNSGNSTGPHLHFEVRPGGGAAIDPLTWLRNHGLDPT